MAWLDAGPRFQGALGEIYLLPASFTFVGLFEFVGEDLSLGLAVGALADKGLQTFKLFETWAMLGCRSHVLNLLLQGNWTGIGLGCSSHDILPDHGQTSR